MRVMGVDPGLTRCGLSVVESLGGRQVVALDVDVVFSPFFNALPIRRTGIYMRGESLTVPVVYVMLPEFAVKPASITYHSASDGIKLHSPVADTTITVDENGFILDYPGLAERI